MINITCECFYIARQWNDNDGEGRWCRFQLIHSLCFLSIGILKIYTAFFIFTLFS